jgi:hypothetical protein
MVIPSLSPKSSYREGMMKSKQRFVVHMFPSYLGTPWATDSLFLAQVFWLLRVIFNPNSEVTINDRMAGKRHLKKYPNIWHDWHDYL